EQCPAAAGSRRTAPAEGVSHPGAPPRALDAAAGCGPAGGEDQPRTALARPRRRSRRALDGAPRARGALTDSVSDTTLRRMAVSARRLVGRSTASTGAKA